MKIPMRVAVTMNTIVVIEDQATKQSYDSEPLSYGNRTRHTMRVRRSHSSDCWSVVPKMRRKGRRRSGNFVRRMNQPAANDFRVHIKYERQADNAGALQSLSPE